MKNVEPPPSAVLLFLEIRERIETEAGVLIGGGPRAFQKYESGDLLPSRAISSALVLLDHDPDALAVLKNLPAAHQARTPSPAKPQA